MCCICKKIKVNENWVGEEYSHYNSTVENAGEEISSEYCPKCLKVNQEETRLRKLVWNKI